MAGESTCDAGTQRRRSCLPPCGRWKGGSRFRGWGWLAKVPSARVLPNDVDTAHGVQFFDVYSFATTTSNTAQEKKERGYNGDVAHA